MEAATSQRALSGEKAARIVAAMRSSVAQRGVAGSTFDHVAREAGVSRGLLHYYFATKEKLLAEVVRHDCDLRMDVLDAQLADASTADDFIALLRGTLITLLRDDPDFVTVIFELFTLSRRNDEIQVEFADLLRRTREHVGTLLAAKQEEGVLHLRAEPDEVAGVLFALADGMSMRMLTEPDRDWEPAVEAAVVAVRALLDDR